MQFTFRLNLLSGLNHPKTAFNRITLLLLLILPTPMFERLSETRANGWELNSGSQVTLKAPTKPQAYTLAKLTFCYWRLCDVSAYRRVINQ